LRDIVSILKEDNNALRLRLSEAYRRIRELSIENARLKDTLLQYDLERFSVDSVYPLIEDVDPKGYL